MENNMNTIDLEDLVTLVCTEFVKQNKDILQEHYTLFGKEERPTMDYLKMNMKRRRKISEKLIDSLLDQT